MENERKTEVHKAPLDYVSDVKLDILKYAKHKFKIGGFAHKKVKIPIFEAGLDKELLLTLREFDNMVTNYWFTNTQPQVDQAYKLFGATLRRTARDTWREILLDPGVNSGTRNANRLPLHIGAFRNAHLILEAYDNQKEYLSTTKKQRLLWVKDWVRRMKAIHAYLPLIDVACPKFTKQELVQHCITPNIPNQWWLTF